MESLSSRRTVRSPSGLVSVSKPGSAARSVPNREKELPITPVLAEIIRYLRRAAPESQRIWPRDILMDIGGDAEWVEAWRADTLLQLQAFVGSLLVEHRTKILDEVHRLNNREQEKIILCALAKVLRVLHIQPQASPQGENYTVSLLPSMGHGHGDRADFSIVRKEVPSSEDKLVSASKRYPGCVRRGREAAEAALVALSRRSSEDISTTDSLDEASPSSQISAPVKTESRQSVWSLKSSPRRKLKAVLWGHVAQADENSASVEIAQRAAAKALSKISLAEHDGKPEQHGSVVLTSRPTAPIGVVGFKPAIEDQETVLQARAKLPPRISSLPRQLEIKHWQMRLTLRTMPSTVEASQELVTGRPLSVLTIAHTMQTATMERREDLRRWPANISKSISQSFGFRLFQAEPTMQVCAGGPSRQRCQHLRIASTDSAASHNVQKDADVYYGQSASKRQRSVKTLRQSFRTYLRRPSSRM